MAVTSIWSIKGWIGKVINYAENPDKTKENNEGRISENQSRSTQGLNDVITYAVNAEKIRYGGNLNLWKWNLPEKRKN